MAYVTQTLKAVPEYPDGAKTCYRLDNDELPIRAWLVWVMLLDKSITLRAVTTSEKRAKVYAEALRHSMHDNVLRTTVEPMALNHLYGGMMDKLW